MLVLFVFNEAGCVSASLCNKAEEFAKSDLVKVFILPQRHEGSKKNQETN